jgi:hypothetical protein
METAADKIGEQNQRVISFPTREQRMFRTSSWTTAPTGSPYRAQPTWHFLDVPLEES